MAQWYFKEFSVSWLGVFHSSAFLSGQDAAKEDSQVWNLAKTTVAAMVPMVFRGFPGGSQGGSQGGSPGILHAEIQRASGQIDGGMLKDCGDFLFFSENRLFKILDACVIFFDEIILQYFRDFVLCDLEGTEIQHAVFRRWSWKHKKISLNHRESTWTIPSGNSTVCDIENGPVEIVDLPIHHGDFPARYVKKNQAG